MTWGSLIYDLSIFSIFLIIGFALRELIAPLRELFLPASIIGGVVALVLGQQCLGLIVIPNLLMALPAL